MSFTKFGQLQEKQRETEDELNQALRELSNTQTQLQKEKSSNREMREDVERATGRLAKNLAKLELLEKKIAYSDLFMQAKDVKCWKKDSDKEVKELNLRILQAVTILEQMQRSGRLQLSSLPQEAPAKEEFHCECCQQKSKAGVLIQDGKVINVPPPNAGAVPKQGPTYLEKREADSSFRAQNKQLLSQIEAERKRRRETESEVDELKTALKDQKKTIERLHENRRADPSANVDVNAAVRARADSAFTQSRIAELEEVIAMKVDENANLQKAVEKERQRADLNEKEVNRVEKEAREVRRNKDDEKNLELRQLIKKYFDAGSGPGPTANVNVEVMKSYIRDLEGQLETPDNAAFLKRIDACIERVDFLEKEKKGLKEYVINLHKKLEDQEKDTELICKRLEYANEKNENSEIRRRQFEQIAERMTEARDRVQEEYDNFKRSVENGLGNLNDEIIAEPAIEGVVEEDDDEDLELTEEDLDHIDPSELEEFLKNF